MNTKKEKTKKFISLLVRVCGGYKTACVLTAICPAAGVVFYLGRIGMSQLLRNEVKKHREVIETLEEVIQK